MEVRISLEVAALALAGVASGRRTGVPLERADFAFGAAALLLATGRTYVPVARTAASATLRGSEPGVQVELKPVMNRQWHYDAQPAGPAAAVPDRPERPRGAA